MRSTTYLFVEVKNTFLQDRDLLPPPPSWEVLMPVLLTFCPVPISTKFYMVLVNGNASFSFCFPPSTSLLSFRKEPVALACIMAQNTPGLALLHRACSGVSDRPAALDSASLRCCSWADLLSVVLSGADGALIHSLFMPRVRKEDTPLLCLDNLPEKV